MARNSQGIIDALDFSPVLEHQRTDGVKLTFTVPTDVTGTGDTISVLTLKNQLKAAREQLLERGLSAPQITRMLAPVSELLEDSSYWRLQSRGLVIFAADGFFLPIRVPIELGADLCVDEHFCMLPLAPILASDRKLYILALSKNSVRLFDSTRNVIAQLPLENVPASFDEVVDSLPERVVDVRSGAAGAQGTPSFHGPDGDVDRALLEKYIHAIGQALGQRLGTARSQLLVLAAVAEYLPLFTAASAYPAVFDGVIAGNPEHTLADDLRSAAWLLVSAHEAEREAKEQDQARSQIHSGKGSFDLAEIARAAADGRVDTLYLPRDTAHITRHDDRQLANLALLGTLQTSGTVRTLGDIEGSGIATFRY